MVSGLFSFQSQLLFRQLFIFRQALRLIFLLRFQQNRRAAPFECGPPYPKNIILIFSLETGDAGIRSPMSG